MIIFTKFHEDRTKIVDFLLMANFLVCAVFYSPDFSRKSQENGSNIAFFDANMGAY